MNPLVLSGSRNLGTIFQPNPNLNQSLTLRFHTCYGWLPLWDWLYGTDAAFEKSPVHFARDIRLHTLKSAREVVPDDYGKKTE